MKKWLLALISIVTVGGLAPPTATSSAYTLVCSYFDEPRAAVYDMNNSGTLLVRAELSVPDNPELVTVSPDGRAFVISQNFYEVEESVDAASSWFFVDQSGTIGQAKHGPRPAVPSVFSPDGLYCYLGITPCRSCFLDYDNKSISVTGYSQEPLLSVHTLTLGYSDCASGLVWTGGAPYYVQLIPVFRGGRLGAAGNPFYYSDNGSAQDMDVSPGGRYAVVLGQSAPQLAVIEIHSDGSFSLVQEILLPLYSEIGSPYRVRYTPNGRFVLVSSTGYHFLVSFSVDPGTGTLTRAGYADSFGTLGGFPIDALAITPDSQFVVIPNDLFEGSTFNQTFMVFRLGDDGSLTLVTQTRHDFPGYVSDMDFIPPYREPVTATSTGWMFYQ